MHNKRQTKVDDILKIMTRAKWKWAGHVTRVKDNRWTVRCTEMQVRKGRDQEVDREADDMMTSNIRKDQLGLGKLKIDNNGES